MQKHIAKLTCKLTLIKLQRQVEEFYNLLAKMKKKKLNDFKLLDQDEYDVET